MAVIDNNDIDNMLSSLGISTSTVSSQEDTSTVEPTEESLSEGSLIDSLNEDLDAILQDNGFSSLQEDEEENEEENEEEDTESLEAEEHEEPSAEEEQSREEESVEEENNDSTEEQSEDAEDTFIPLNSPTLLIDESTTRFSGAGWYSEIQKQKIIIAGIGGIGSNLVYQIARMVPSSITIYDDDNVEMVNMAGQLFSFYDLGKSKVDAMAEMITNYTSMRQVNAIKARFTDETEPGDIMLCGFDSINARKVFFNSWVNHIKDKSEAEKSKCLFMDGRLSMDVLQILCIRGDDDYNIGRYKEEFLFSEAEAEPTVCSMKQTTYLACMIGSLMTNLFTNFVANLLDPIIPYDLPFFTEYDAQNMIFNTEN